MLIACCFQSCTLDLITLICALSLYTRNLIIFGFMVTRKASFFITYTLKICLCLHLSIDHYRHE